MDEEGRNLESSEYGSRRDRKEPVPREFAENNILAVGCEVDERKKKGKFRMDGTTESRVKDVVRAV